MVMGKNEKKLEKIEKENEVLVKKLNKRQQVKGLWFEFLKFLKEFSVIGIAIGLVIGNAVTALVQNIVSGIITPLIQLIIPSGVLKDLNYEVNGVKFAIGPVINSLINFAVVALFMFLLAKVVFRNKEVTRELLK